MQMQESFFGKPPRPTHNHTHHPPSLPLSSSRRGQRSASLFPSACASQTPTKPPPLLLHHHSFLAGFRRPPPRRPLAPDARSRRPGPAAPRRIDRHDSVAGRGGGRRGAARPQERCFRGGDGHGAAPGEAPRHAPTRGGVPQEPAPPRAAGEEAGAVAGAGGGGRGRARARYGCAFEDDEDGARGGGGGVAAPGRLVWGKVRQHPWWPGQVFDAADASALALARRRPRGAVLVAYFWDKTFAWNEPATLRPLRDGFARPAAPSGVGPLGAAVDTALDEVARRVEAGLSCCCGGKGKGEGEATASTNRQVIDNAGVREGAYGAAVDAAFARGALRGEALVGYISALATAPLAGADRVDLAIATAQLKAFGRWRGSTRGLPEYTVVHGIDGVAAGRTKRRRSPRAGGDGKRKVSRGSANGSAGRDGGDYEALESEDFPQATPQQMSTKIGKLMSRAAQQMSLSPVILRANGDAPPPMPRSASCRRVTDKLPPMNNGDPSCGAGLVNERRPAAEMEAGLVLNFSSANAVPSTGHLTMIFSRFGPVKEVRAENSSALVIFKKGAHADEAFSGTAQISSISSSLISFRLTNLLPAAPIDPPQSMLLDPLPVEALQ